MLSTCVTPSRFSCRKGECRECVRACVGESERCVPPQNTFGASKARLQHLRERQRIGRLGRWGRTSGTRAALGSAPRTCTMAKYFQHRIASKSNTRIARAWRAAGGVLCIAGNAPRRRMIALFAPQPSPSLRRKHATQRGSGERHHAVVDAVVPVASHCPGLVGGRSSVMSRHGSGQKGRR